MAHLPITYESQKQYVEKAKDIADFEREGICKICEKDLEHDRGLYIVCPTAGCETVTHMACLSKHFINEQNRDDLVPISGKCPGCDTELRWIDLVKELSLRMRGQKEVQNLLKAKRVKKGKASQLSQTIVESSDVDSDEEPVLDEDLDLMRDFASQTTGAAPGDSWNIVNDSDASDTESVASNASQSKKPKRAPAKKPKSQPTLRKIVEDSDWDEAQILD